MWLKKKKSGILADLITFRPDEELLALTGRQDRDDSLMPDHGFMKCSLYIKSDFFFRILFMDVHGDVFHTCVAT